MHPLGDIAYLSVCPVSIKRPQFCLIQRLGTMLRKHGLAGVALVLALDKGVDAFTVFPGSVGHNTGSNVVKTTRPR